MGTHITENKQREDRVKGNQDRGFSGRGRSRLCRGGKRSLPLLFLEDPAILNMKNCQTELYTVNADSRHPQLASTQPTDWLAKRLQAVFKTHGQMLACVPHVVRCTPGAGGSLSSVPLPDFCPHQAEFMLPRVNYFHRQNFLYSYV